MLWYDNLRNSRKPLQRQRRQCDPSQLDKSTKYVSRTVLEVGSFDKIKSLLILKKIEDERIIKTDKIYSFNCCHINYSFIHFILNF